MTWKSYNLFITYESLKNCLNDLDVLQSREDYR